MASHNSNESGIGPAAAFAIAGVALAAVILFAALTFLSLIMTVLALIAWTRPLKLGSITIAPEDARSFVYNGLAGLILLPVFALFCSLFLGFPIAPREWFYIVIGGYVAGSAGLAILKASVDAATDTTTDEPPARVRFQGSEPVRMKGPVRSTQPEPFRFAEWDDEEELS
ncbi:hypothetical protein [Aurantimonas sp. VKM B-3413]|uniref:hypothetical protein n=1 Tax=Aurantimonas sp. VKM B-3413 TaxID=2779401 RepID=UPI001E2FA14F|nr:hypothetical protein [Aurantimonas sp. VKM B-3413]MCB8838080.1 hypothetical protein [Aurantimonas sp. VKM B-3413]